MDVDGNLVDLGETEMLGSLVSKILRNSMMFYEFYAYLRDDSLIGNH